jgi:hypothetical protein
MCEKPKASEGATNPTVQVGAPNLDPNKAAFDQKSLEMLFDYTKFHIGIYLTLSASYITAVTAKLGDSQPLLAVPQRWAFWCAVGAFALAGLAGGVIASSLTQTSARSSREFLDEYIGPWEVYLFQDRARYWTWVEHTALWLGLAFAVVSVSGNSAPP